MHATYGVFPDSLSDKLKVRRTVLYSQPSPCSVKMKYIDVPYSPGTHDLNLFSAQGSSYSLFKNRPALNFGDRLRRALTSFSSVKFAFLL